MSIFSLTEEIAFPSPNLARPDGLLAVGGDLCVERLLLAYRTGIFPWSCDDCPILWWSPDPRFVLFPHKLKVSHSLERIIQSGRFRITYDQAFDSVIYNCRNVERPGQPGTWITEDMVQAYCRLHEVGHAHSVEVWEGDELAGGLYGIIVDRCFCGESMFARVSNASKVGFVWLVQELIEQGFSLVDCQVPTDHLKSLGAEEIPRTDFLRLLRSLGSDPAFISLRV